MGTISHHVIVHDVVLWEVNWWRFVTLLKQNWITGFKKSLLLAPDRRHDCGCSKMVIFPCRNRSVPEPSPLLVREPGIGYPHLFVKWNLSRLSSAIWKLNSLVKYTSICIAHFYANRLKCAQTWITQFYLQITPCLPLLPSCRTSPPFGWYSFYRPTEGRRLSRPGWLVTYRNKVPPR